ncbi:MAG: vWA domain-containing protein [Planctomycetia bacterium]
MKSSPRRAAAIAAVVLLLVAAGRPRWGEAARPLYRGDVVWWLALDVSRSMLARDVPGDRSTVARRLAAAVAREAGGGRAAVVVFAGSSKIVCPPTTDLAAVAAAVDDAAAGLGPAGGSDWRGAVQAVVDQAARWDGVGPKRRHRLLLATDGGQNAVDPAALAGTVEAARRADVVVFGVTIGDGAPPGAVIPLSPPEEKAPVLLIENRTPVRTVRRDADVKQLAEATGGAFWAVDAATAATLDADRWAADRLEPAAGLTEAARTPPVPAERYQWFLAPAVLLAMWGFRP